MPITLTTPLAWKQADADQLKMLQALQGNILKGHGRHHTANIFIKFDPAKTVESRRLLRELANHHVTSAHQQLLGTERFKAGEASAGAFVHVALSNKGYTAIGAAAAAPTDVDFVKGMKHPDSLAALADPPVLNWEVPFRDDLHAVVLAAHDTPALAATLTATLLEIIRDAGATVVHVQRGGALFNSANDGIEHFGYVDGRSQPLLLVEDLAKENADAGSSRWDPKAALQAALLLDPGAKPGDAAVSFGSYFVFRKLEQDVRGFKTREQMLADALDLAGADDRELAGALIVGRFEDGTPVTLSNKARGVAPPNDFDYGGDAGKRCPFHAHIRKSNPRGSGGGGADPEPAEHAHLMPRRGIPYEDVKRQVHPDELPEADTLAEFIAKVAPLLPTGAGQGLLFMAYNRVIGQQFKFTQQTWVNSPGFPVPGVHGIDPVIGQGTPVPGQQRMFKQWDNVASRPVAFDFAGFVKMKGGEYFFSPSLNFLREL